MSIQDKKSLILCASNQNIVRSSYNELHNNFMAQVTRRGTVMRRYRNQGGAKAAPYSCAIALTYGLSQVFELANMGRPDDSKAGKHGIW
jgi:hypothetical protein